MQVLWGICKKAIENGLCLGCNKLEDIHFTGQAKCDLVETKKVSKEITGQERIKL